MMWNPPSFDSAESALISEARAGGSADACAADWIAGGNANATPADPPVMAPLEDQPVAIDCHDGVPEEGAPPCPTQPPAGDWHPGTAGQDLALALKAVGDLVEDLVSQRQALEEQVAQMTVAVMTRLLPRLARADIAGQARALAESVTGGGWTLECPQEVASSLADLPEGVKLVVAPVVAIRRDDAERRFDPQAAADRILEQITATLQITAEPPQGEASA